MYDIIRVRRKQHIICCFSRTKGKDYKEEKMKVYVTIKQASKRKDFITKEELQLKKDAYQLRELIAEIVTLYAKKYNNAREGNLLIKYLSHEEIDSQITVGKVGFNNPFSDKKADINKSIEVALLGFEDGLYRVFVGEKEIFSFDEEIKLKEGDILTFIRFVMLSGRMW